MTIVSRFNFAQDEVLGAKLNSANAPHRHSETEEVGQIAEQSESDSIKLTDYM